MGLVLWIDHNTFGTSLIERAFKKKSLPFYTVSSVDDFSYLVDDLNPAVIVLDGATYLKNPEKFQSQYQASAKMQATPFILLEAGELSFIKIKLGELKRPLDPFKLPEQIEKILSLS